MAEPPAGYHPVVNVACFLGSALEANNQNLGYCYSFGWRQVWGMTDLRSVAKSKISCIVRDMTLEGWDDSSKSSIPPVGIEVRPVDGYENLTTISKFLGQGMESGENGLVPPLLEVGYEVDKHIFGHGYDWRLGVHDWQRTSFPRLRDMIERAVKIADGRGVILTGISMAGPYTHAFLKWIRTLDMTWVARHVHVFAPVAGPWNGAVDAMAGLLSQVDQAFHLDGACPTCIPVKNATSMPTLAGWLLGKIGSRLTPAAHSWPSMFFLSPGVDYSTTPPIDPVAVRIVHAAAEACASGFSSACGALKTRNGWRIDPLQLDECAECIVQHKWRSCPDGFKEQTQFVRIVRRTRATRRSTQLHLCIGFTTNLAEHSRRKCSSMPTCKRPPLIH